MYNKYPIHNISRLRMGTDGAGIRTLVLLSGCPLKCKFCINKSTWDGTEQPKMMTAEEVYSKICIDRPYILATNGGITFGGGEPLLYPELINEFRTICEPEMNICVETSLHVPWNNIDKITDAVDVFYVDIKSLNPKIYREYTGDELELSYLNLKKLLEVKQADSIIVRIPLISGFVDKKQQIETKNLLYKMGIRHFDLFEYRV